MQDQVTMLHNLPDYSTNDSELQYVSYSQTANSPYSVMQTVNQTPQESLYMTQMSQPVVSPNMYGIQTVQSQVQLQPPVQPQVQPMMQPVTTHPSYVPYTAYVNHGDNSNISNIVNEKVNTEMKKLEHENKIDEITRKFQHFENKFAKMGTVEAFTGETCSTPTLVIIGVSIALIFILFIIILVKLDSIAKTVANL
jgi:hypothetical protein